MEARISSSPILLDSLPDLVLRAICDFVGDCRQLALASKACLHPARATIFATISIRVPLHSPDEMVARVVQLTQRLGRLHCLVHVRTLRLLDDRPKHKFADYDDHLNENMEAHIYTRYSSDYDEGYRIGFAQLADIAPGVRVLSELISRLPGLKDCAYAWDIPLPLELFEAIGARRCRLHMESFHLNGLLRPPHEQNKIMGAFELRIATSPLLQTVKINGYDERHPEGLFDFHLEALLDMVKGRAPGLRKTSLGGGDGRVTSLGGCQAAPHRKAA
ncbi:hypothetical protein BST61_g2163 [Cercospora zeina]